MRFIQAIIVLLNVGPLPRLFHAIYALGLRTMLRALGKYDAIHAVYGTGSFFEGRPLYGHSDIDLIIVIDERFSRSEGIHYDIATTYNRVRRWFPFLGHWDEKVANLVFLDEAKIGFPVLESFRVRLKQGRLTLLHGKPVPEHLHAGPVTATEAIVEINTLVRMATIVGGRAAWKRLTWKRYFNKLLALIEVLELDELAQRMRQREDLAFLDVPDRRLYFWGAPANRLHKLLLECAQQVMDTVAAREQAVTLSDPPHAEPAAPFDPDPDGEVAGELRSLFDRAGVTVADLRVLPTQQVGIQPRLFYFQIDRAMPCVDAEGGAFEVVHRLMKALKKDKTFHDSMLVRAEGRLFIVAPLETYTDIIPLNPLLHANIYARLEGSDDFGMPSSIHEQLHSEAAQQFDALRASYAKHKGWIPKLSYPCIYREDDFDTIRDAYNILRAFAQYADGQAHFHSSRQLTDYLIRRHPECEAFLRDLLAYYWHLKDESVERPEANNLYCALHEFMAGVLGGEKAITMEPHDKRLTVTVGIVTRNRCRDLRDALESLCGQTRVPDEVIVVDNGSTDDTKAVTMSFDDRIPLQYHYLPDASIPLARNVVIDNTECEIIAYTDDDCGIPAGWLASVERGFLRAKNIGIVGGWVEHWPREEDTAVDRYYEMFHNNKT